MIHSSPVLVEAQWVLFLSILHGEDVLLKLLFMFISFLCLSPSEDCRLDLSAL